MNRNNYLCYSSSGEKYLELFCTEVLIITTHKNVLNGHEECKNMYSFNKLRIFPQMGCTFIFKNVDPL